MANEPRGGSGNFSQDRDKASEAGKKGGQMGHGQQQQGGQNQDRQQQQENRQPGQQGSGNFSQDREPGKKSENR